jgi:hypothetical protein
VLLKENTHLNIDGRLADILLSRAQVMGSGGNFMPTDYEASEYSEAFLMTQPDLHASTGHELPDLYDELQEKCRLENINTPLGSLAAHAEISVTTGCWAIIKAWRDAKGYTFVWNPKELGYDPGTQTGFSAQKAYRIAYILAQREYDPDFVLKPGTPLDHLCRFTGCCNPHHIEPVTTIENNIRQRLAHPIENALALGQLMLGPTGYDWLDTKTNAAQQEETGIVVNTRFGPYRILKLDDDPVVIRGEALDDDLLNIIRPPSTKKSVRKSRAKKPNPLPEVTLDDLLAA